MWVTGTIDSAMTVENGAGRHLLGGDLGADHEAGRAGAAHAERVPRAGRLELELTLHRDRDHLVVLLRLGCAAQRHEQVVGVARRS